MHVHVKYLWLCGSDSSQKVKVDIVDGFIFVGTNFRGLNKNDTFFGFKIRGNSTLYFIS